MSGYEVSTDVLDEHARRWDAHADTVGEWPAGLSEAEVGRESFGYIPGIGSRVWDAYEQLRDSCWTCLNLTFEAMSEVRESLRASSENYRHAESATHDAFQGIESRLNVSGSGPDDGGGHGR